MCVVYQLPSKHFSNKAILNLCECKWSQTIIIIIIVDVNINYIFVYLQLHFVQSSNGLSNMSPAMRILCRTAHALTILLAKPGSYCKTLYFKRHLHVLLSTPNNRSTQFLALHNASLYRNLEVSFLQAHQPKMLIAMVLMDILNHLQKKHVQSMQQKL